MISSSRKETAVKQSRTVTVALALISLVGAFAFANNAAAPSPLAPIKALAGKWKVVTDDPNAPAAYIEFKVTSGGGSVLETMFPGMPHEMVNVYTVDGDDVLVTHYCAGQNAPRMKMTRNENGSMLFEFVDGANVKPDRPFMGKLELKVVSDDEIQENWTSLVGEKEAGHAAFTLKRVQE